jgi:hypothetical protein
MKTFRLIFCFLLLLSFKNVIGAEHGTYLPATDVSISADNCGGIILFSFLYLNTSDTDEKLENFNVRIDGTTVLSGFESNEEDCTGEWFGHDNGSDWCVNSLNSDVTFYEDDFDNNDYWIIVKYKVPEEKLGQEIQFKLTGQWTEGGTVKQDFDGVNAIIKTATTYNPAAPTALSSSTDECNQITLNWTNPNITCDQVVLRYFVSVNPIPNCPDQEFNGFYYLCPTYGYCCYTIEVSRDGGDWIDVGKVTTYTDNDVVDGTEYAYRIRTKYSTVYNRYSYSDIVSAPSDGHSIALLSSPSGLGATGTCSGTVEVTWQWSSVNPASFEIARSTSENGTYTVLSSSITGDKRKYIDNSVTAGSHYYYKLKTKNECEEWGSYSSVIDCVVPHMPAAPGNLNYSVTNNTLNLTWTDNSNIETGFILKKSNVVSGVVSEYNLGSNTTTFNDDELELCVPYIYRLKAVGDCGNSDEVATSEIGLTPDLSNTFSEGSFKASKGYYPDIVHLEWDNNNRQQIDIFYIYRKVYGSTSQTLLATLNGTLRTYDDKYAANGVLYEYSIKGEGMCNNIPVPSNIVSTVGFKVPTATINGKVTYRDGNPTIDVTITAESTELPVFSSISLNGSDAYMQIDDLEADLPVFTFQSYIRFDVVEDAAIFNRGTQYKLNYSSGSFVFDVGGNTLSVAYTPVANQFIQITTVFSGDSSFIYIDGELKAEKTGVSAPSSDNSSFIIGNGTSGFFDGYVDEIRLWKTALTSSQVGINYNKYINGNETDLLGYYRLNENVAINKFFDVSRSGNSYNENHGTLHNCTYANVNPLIEQLWFRALTDETGNYLITGIPYLSGGSIYKIVPMLAPHEFNPGYKTLFVGDGASVHNNIDFSDISTVPVTVEVFYNNTTFPVKGVWVKLDGQIQVDKNEQIVQTNENGTVTFEVPYGNHYLSFEKQNHQFEQTYFPGITEGNILRRNFNEPVQVKIKDITRVKLAGKVVGGPIEAAKDLLSNTNPTNNNIGEVSIELITERGFNIDLNENLEPLDDTPKTVLTTTDPETGYFEFSLLPEKYKPNGQLSIKTINTSSYSFDSDEDLAIIDMSSKFIEISETDSIFVNKVFSHLDTTAVYNHRRDWIYRSEPEFSVSNKDGGKIISATEFIYVNEDDSITIPLATEVNNTIVYPFGKPIFFFGNEYSIVLKAFEQYVNVDNLDTDEVPVTDGVLIINNNLALQDKAVELSLDKNGEAEYKFLADFPNIADPYTKNLNITFKAGPTIVQWPANSEYEAYILGGRPTGNNFVTTGPSVVDYILRDPPGSGSSATLEKGFVNVQSYNWSISNTTDMSVGLAYQMGAKLETVSGIGFAVVTDFETDNFIKGTIQNSYTGGTGFQQTTQLNFNESFSTSSDPLFVGSDGDVFIGHSTNIIYGISKIMKIMPGTEVPSGSNAIAVQGSYAIAIEDGLRVNPEFDTYFIYSQRIIENENIPHLIKLRNIVLEKNYYTKVVTDITDPRYGSNNDDTQLWGSSASDDFYDGLSYKYTGPTEVIDSVRFYNQQIANWKEVLAMNEQQKLNALADDKHQNISFGAGSVYQSSIGSEDSYVENTKFGFSVSAELAMSLGFAINKMGFRLDASIKNTTSGEKLWSDGSTTTTKVSYTLSDQDLYNYITTDVLKCQSGNGPVFKTRGGQTSCPHEKEELTQYFEPGNHTLNFATMRIEGGKIAVANPISPVVPETSPALFTVYLTNVSEAEKDGWYIFGVDVSSNPYGAKIKMDGSTINDGVAVFIPYGQTVVKTLEVWKGRADVNEYEDLYLYLASTCEVFWEDASISAYFEAACSQVEFEYPGDGWVINANDDDKMLVKASGYNLQHAGFNDFHFQYTPTGTSNWTTAHIFTNDPEKAGEDNTTVIDGATTIQFLWDMGSLPDRGYDIRLVSHCENGTKNYSDVLSGILDGKRPQVFGTPQPADGILDVDDDIMVQFNEPIEGGLLTKYNFDIKGTLNNYPIEHQAFLRYNGTSDYCYISEGLSFNDKSMTVEFWMKPGNYSNSMVILSQGNDPANSVEIGLRDGDSTYFKIGTKVYVAELSFTSQLPSTEWQHMAYVYNDETGDVFIYQNDEIILEEYSQTIEINNSGKTYIGKSAVTGSGYFAGDLHELRIWSKIWLKGDIYANQYTALSGNEIGLYGYWPMDDASGNLAIDKSASRHMEVFAPWIVEPGGSAWDFTGNNYLEFYTAYFGIIPEMDYTLEFWFKASTPTQPVCLFSSQKGDGTEGEGLKDKALSIYATPDGKIWVDSKGNTFEATSNNYFDNSWHHFALVVHRRGNVISLIDGKVQNENQNTIVGGIANNQMRLGVRKWFNTEGDGDSGQDYYFSGKLDEFRLWNLAKSTKQILLDMNSKLHGDEFGLMVYLPFEGYSDDGFGNQIMANTLKNYVSDPKAQNAESISDEGFSSDAPNIKDARPVEDIPIDFVAAEDRIIITPQVYLMPQLEKNILEIKVGGVEDKYGNVMASPVTWMAFVHRNQVRWEDERRYFTKEVYQPLEFVASIKNTGGQQVGFNIVNLPLWLKASPASGVINPESTLEIIFTVNSALNIGDYNQDIILRTENGFDEKLPLNIRVYMKPPSWSVDVSKFENTMNIVGKIKIDGVFSTDIFDMLAAFKKGTDSIRGVSNIRYVEEFDSYLVFLTVYGNTPADKKVADSLDFRIWDASEGQILDNVMPFKVILVDNTVFGTTINPQIFESTGFTRQHIVLKKGWNWVSFNKLSPNRNSLRDFFWALEPSNTDLIKTHDGSFSIYYGGNWSTGITSINFMRMYQMKTSKTDTIVFSGTDLVPEDNPIPLVTGWNHIGYIPDLTMDVTNALRNFVPSESDIIKSQTAFSMYDSRTGWIGTLDVMRPGEGYKFKVNGSSANLKYPNNTILKNDWIVEYLSAPMGWKNDLLQYEGNLSVVAKLDVGNLPNININNQMILGAFIHNECHGYISPLNQSGLDYRPFFLNVSNNEPGQQIEFRLFDGLTGNSYSINEVKPFVHDGVYGTIQEPLVLTLKGLITGAGEIGSESYLRCYPNPFNSEINVEFSGNLNVKSIDVITISGSLVKRIFNDNAVDGKNLVKWDGTNGNGAEVTTGVYFIRVVTDNKVETMKISKTE